ncbi:unnamed protein product [Didymodactylos carnosus]|uniref:Uncharacterized protein n=1 Tax=Didymodactylos carnosus TaxID=1234261 RepID=A0A815R6A6_9BILA|nr:unnamed protein product [Didymodactylos carnosus]CAF4339963.1 unnamed protein product [Didymodactylos carnosus]
MRIRNDHETDKDDEDKDDEDKDDEDKDDEDKDDEEKDDEDKEDDKDKDEDKDEMYKAYTYHITQIYTHSFLAFLFIGTRIQLIV